MHICHTYAASATEGSSSQETTRLREASRARHSPEAQECLDIANPQGPQDICSEIERAFLHEVETAEELGKAIEPGTVITPCSYKRFFGSIIHVLPNQYMIGYRERLERKELKEIKN